MTARYYKLNVGKLPDDLYRPETPASSWLQKCESTNAKSFPPNSLHKVDPISWDVEAERIIGISLYMISNVFPFLILPFLILYIFVPASRLFIQYVSLYVVILAVIEFAFFKPHFRRKYKLDADNLHGGSTEGMKRYQYAYTERNITKYLSMNFVWPQSIHRPAMESTPLLFCIVPHGVAPFGITAYPLWSKLFNDRLCRWTCAPVVLKIPLVSTLMRNIGYIPAKAKNILETLTKREENVGVILDGIAGMFHQSKHEERAYLKKRKGIVKIALRAGAPIVPVYGFGHTEMYTVVVDPFGILERLSHMLEASLTPFFGRFGWFLGPPRRVPVVVCMGEPVVCPKVDEPSQEQIDEYHQKLLDAYEKLFNTHKEAYGWDDKKLIFV
uniref:Acyltransferase n=1 Tax=Helicotheca tamesis TaxID=374047 RepID=A0A7S2HJE3_9STRA|mmetsp:Transcript_18653/g.25704  ORF Transcript_18653/g.25704 Transcript_18653/m.25704 type:complete len:385 (+) Transcript_18653:122-1276(+)|eukprot:CAMPEP_0185727660 /NCGR_PEP_ID=MMETSP1171-20130828/3291_1 /TAXON_ID=374046 /ORGANISM="Helicotheca tamensis, Strain CCMP826" /LENGTH=384 /DNA_ID=CAMNT_0028396271 /DNA_START=76 /DNA_END=1230 /DNA_ORIENTATION=-